MNRHARRLLAGLASGVLIAPAATAHLLTRRMHTMIAVAMMAGHDPQAQSIFDGFVRVFRAFPSSLNPGLMSWAIGPSCQAVSGPNSAASSTESRRSRVLAVSTTKRTCLPRPTSSTGSLTENSKVTLRRSTSATLISTVTSRPIGVGARWSMDTCAPTESSPGSRCSSSMSRAWNWGSSKMSAMV